MDFQYKNMTLISITDRAGNEHPDKWRNKYLNHTGSVAFYPDDNMHFASYLGGGLFAYANKYYETDTEVVVTTTNSIYTFAKEAANE